MERVTVVIKTSAGAKWLLSQVGGMVRRGHRVHVILPDGPGSLADDLTMHGAEVEALPWDFSLRPGLALLDGLRAIRRSVRRHHSEVVFYHLYASALASRLATVGLGVKRIMMVAGPLYLENTNVRRVERWMCRMDHELIAGSGYTRRAYLKLGYPETRLHNIAYGVDCEHFHPMVASRQELLGVRPSTFIAIMVAFVYAPKALVFPGVGIKGHEVIMEAWTNFHERHPDSLMVFVGGGFTAESETYRQDLMERFGVPAREDVRWLDSVADVRPYYACADISVSPSLSENHGAALEASAMGVPSIVSDAGGLPETVTPESGWVVPAGDVNALQDALETAWSLHNQGLLGVRGEAARTHVERRFDQRECSGRVADVVAGTS